ncbi:MAG: hypothetical protein ACI4UM_05480 [Succinivibrio sp.]
MNRNLSHRELNDELDAINTIGIDEQEKTEVISRLNEVICVSSDGDLHLSYDKKHDRALILSRINQVLHYVVLEKLTPLEIICQITEGIKLNILSADKN